MDRKWNCREKNKACYTKGMTSEVCAWVCVRTQRYCKHTHIHSQLRIILGCGPNVNLKSTNTHGTQQREKETEQEEASGYYAWTEVLCCCILKRGLGLVTDTTWTAKVSLIGQMWNKVQMALIDNIRLGDTFLFVFFSIYVLLSHSHTFSLLSFTFSHIPHHPVHSPFFPYKLNFILRP